MKQSPNFIELVLTCGSWQEAQNIADALLGRRLIACAEFLDIKSRFHWKGKLDHSNEVKLIMTTLENHFGTIEAEVKKLHSYETFVLKAIPLAHVSSEASAWLMATAGDDLSGSSNDF